MTDEGAYANTLLSFQIMSLRGTDEKPIKKIRLFSNLARSGANPPKGYHSSIIKSLQHKVSDERYPFGGLPRHVVPRNDIFENAFHRYFCYVLSSATPRSGISSVVDGFLLA